MGPYMLDTNQFNRVLDGTLPIASFAHVLALTTGVQRSELAATSNAERRAKLLEAFYKVGPTKVVAASFAFDIDGAGSNEACWNDGTGTYQNMLDRLRVLDSKSGKRPKKASLNQDRDILIAETAIKNDATLVTDDRNLRQVVNEFGGRAIDSTQFAAEAMGIGLGPTVAKRRRALSGVQ